MIMNHRFYAFIFPVLLMVTFVYYLEIMSDYWSTETHYHPKVHGAFSSKRRKPMKRILFYTPFFGYTPWPMGQTITNYSERCGCNFDQCVISYDQDDLHISDLVLFHARDIKKVDLNKVNQKRPPNQLWVYFVLENPFYAPGVRHIDKFFNLTSSYRLDSDFHYPYRFHVKIDPSEVKLEERNYAQGKIRHIAWGASNCKKLRDQLAQKLHEYGLTIDNFGKCKFPFANSRRFSRSVKAPYDEYKFYFAAENHLCRDYVTEKYWIYAFQEDVNSIPIVLGGANYSNPNIAIPGSFIDALKFSSPKKLAEYLLLLDKNDTLYNEYFKWKKDWKMYDPGRPVQCTPWLCDICQTLHGEKPLKFRKNPLISRIQTSKECTPHEKYFKRWVKQV